MLIKLFLLPLYIMYWIIALPVKFFFWLFKVSIKFCFACCFGFLLLLFVLFCLFSEVIANDI